MRSLLPLISPFILLFSPLGLLAQPSNSVPSNQTFSYVCSQENDQVLVELQNVQNWQSIIQWNCSKKTADVPAGSVKFSCEPQNEGVIAIITVTWLKGTDEQQQLAQWMQQFATQQDMFCSLAKTEIWGQFDQ
jgi:hypothetical protein